MKPIECTEFGEFEGRAAKLYTLTNARGRVLRLTNYGATVTELHVPDRQGRLADVVLGFERLQGYVEHTAFFGATVGRVANRIRASKFALDGKSYQVAATDGPHHLHGGRRGWDKAIWSAETELRAEGPSVRLQHVSPDGDEGYPGRIDAQVEYTLTDEDELVVAMRATTDAATVINLAHHSYWNLAGHHAGSVLEHEVSLAAEEFSPGDPVVPTGELRLVEGTAFDFRRPKPVGRDLERLGNEPLGFDHNWVVQGASGQLRPVARVYEPTSGRVLTLEADAPGVQFYSGNFLDGSLVGKGGQRYGQYAGLCLETQAFPNAINVPAWQDQVILRPGETYRHTMRHRFSVS
ncbi:MAG: Aldose 1-epimerase [Pseudomonadota bacterium]|jgi:aldose 1-epimerase